MSQSESDIVLIGGGAGVAPLRSIILDQLERVGSNRAIDFFYGARNLRELCYQSEFEALARTHDNFRWNVALSEPSSDDEWDGPTGFVHTVTHDLLLRDHLAPEDAEYYLCGPPLMARATVAMLEDLGVPRDRIFFDDFGS